MSTKVYTVTEIDALRDAVWHRVVFGTTKPSGGAYSEPFGKGVVDCRVEEQLRTYIIAGITAEDLIAADQVRNTTKMETPQ